MVRKVIAYKSSFIDFYKSQDSKIQEKIEYVLDLIRHENHIPAKFFKSLKSTDGIYEVRVITAFKSIRILCFLDDGNVVVLTNTFVKKTQKTPRKEIKLAEKLKLEYIREKNEKK